MGPVTHHVKWSFGLFQGEIFVIGSCSYHVYIFYTHFQKMVMPTMGTTWKTCVGHPLVATPTMGMRWETFVGPPPQTSMIVDDYSSD